MEFAGAGAGAAAGAEAAGVAGVAGMALAGAGAAAAGTLSITPPLTLLVWWVVMYDRASVALKKMAAANAGRLRHEVRRAGGAEQAARRARAEGGAHVGALTVLKQYQTDNRDCRQDLHDDNQIEQGAHVIPFQIKSFVSFCFYCAFTLTRNA